MRRLVAVALLVAGVGCATAPPAKRPDESQRMPVNTSIPAELRQGRPEQATTKAGEVEWR